MSLGLQPQTGKQQQTERNVGEGKSEINRKIKGKTLISEAKLMFFLQIEKLISLIITIFNMMNQTNRMLKNLLLLSFIFALIFAANNEVTINSVSKTLDFYTRARGSTMGGTILYISGINFSPNAADIQIYFGPYPCIIVAQGLTVNMISCTTTPMVDPTKMSDLAITMYTTDLLTVTCKIHACLFDYSNSLTPIITEVFPSTAVGNQMIQVFGYHRITDIGDGRSASIGDLKYILINGQTCSTLDILQDYLSLWSIDSINCTTYKYMEVGQYDVNERIIYGDSKTSQTFQKTSLFTNKNYSFRAVAFIDNSAASNIPQSGGLYGHNILLPGNGFNESTVDGYTCTVAGQPCSVLETTTDYLKVFVNPHDVANTVFGALSKDVADANDQTDKFLGSQGFKYTRYARTYLALSNYITALRAGTYNQPIKEDGFITQLGHPTGNGNYLDYLRGYIYIPVDGEYNFYCAADDMMAVYLSSVQSSSNALNMEQILYQDGYTSIKDDPYYQFPMQTVSTKTLKAGYYYMQVVALDYGGGNFYSVSMSTPPLNNLDTKIVNPTWKIDNVKIVPTNILPEIIKVTIDDASFNSSQTYTLISWVSIDGVYKKISSSPLKKGATPDEFKSAISGLSFLSNYNPVVTLQTVDSTGNTTTIPAQIASYVYSITINSIRPDTVTLLPESQPIAGITIEVFQAHSPGLGGTYTLKIDGVDLSVYDGATGTYSTTISASNYLGYVQNALISKFNSPDLTIHTRNVLQYPNQIQFDIVYAGVTSNPVLQIITSALTGGSDNAITATVIVRRAFAGDRPLYSPIPFDFMRTAESKPSFYLTLNKIPIICFKCYYQYATTSEVTVTSLAKNGNGNGLDIVLSTNTYPVEEITITFQNQPCVIYGAATSTTFSCLFNSIGNRPILPAGNDYPKIHLKQLGYLDTSTQPKLSIPLVITSMSPAAAGTFGGTVGTLTGKGFPLHMDETENIDLLLCGNKVTQFFSISEQQLMFTIPKMVTDCTNSNQITVHGIVSTDITFVFDATLDPTIVSLSITSASPIIKQNIDIVGTNFDTIQDHMKVYLYNKTDLTQKYELGIISITDSTQMRCVLGGGRSGEYYLRVAVVGKGMSDTTATSLFKYQILVNTVTAVSTSLGGGYKMTITGSNFAPAKGSTQVFIGTGVNAMCQTTSITSTQIECTVPSMIKTYKADDVLEVVVTQRLIEYSTCVGTCSFSYTNSDTVFLNALSQTTYAAGDTVTITSKNGQDLSAATVKVGDISITQLTVTTTQLTFAYPPLAAGSYTIVVTIAGVNAYPSLSTSTLLSFNSFSSTSGSNKGQIVSLFGNGFPKITDPSIVALYICDASQVKTNIDTYRLNLLFGTPTNLTFVVPSVPDKTCVINVTIGLTFKYVSYAQSLSKTPTVTITDNGNKQYSLLISPANTTKISMIQARYLDYSKGPSKSTYPMSWVASGVANTYTVTPTSYLPCGAFIFEVHFVNKGFADVTSTNPSFQIICLFPTTTPISVSYGGGYDLQIIGAGFHTSNIKDNDIRVCGLKAEVVSADETELHVTVPALVTSVTSTKFDLGEQIILNTKGVVYSDTSYHINGAFDNNTQTYYSSDLTSCFVGLDFGADSHVEISKIRFMPNAEWAVVGYILQGGLFQASQDGVSWTTLFQIDSNIVHTGWNYWQQDSPGSTYRYIRFSHTNNSQCRLAELQFSGIMYSSTVVVEGTPTVCDVIINYSADNPATLTGVVTYDEAKTFIIKGIDNYFGPSIGGTTLTVTANIIEEPIVVTIDGIDCIAPTKLTSTTFTCTTGIRLTPPVGGNSFIVTFNGQPSLLHTAPFLYIDRWSSQTTWGGEVLPRQGDTVFVPEGMTLFMDQSTPILKAIIVQGGTVIFSDQMDLTVDAQYFVFIGGEFRAGLPSAPYQHKLTITLYGGYYDKQLPYFGNKVLGCLNCKFNMHGIQRKPTWTELATTAGPGTNTITVIEPVDWQVGEYIVVAATSYNHYQAEDRIITAVSNDKLTITVDKPFVYNHFSATETYGGKDFVMRAEVALLTRNIVIQGDDTSDARTHGSHLMFTGKVAAGLDASISYTQIRHCGQPKIVGRYCSHFHMAGEVPNSFVKGIAVHHSHARVLTIHGTHYLLVQKNVGYNVKGHNIFIEDGIETNNIIQDNLMINSIASQTLLQSDTSVASYWITNPYNTVIRNHAAGGDFYGIWYQIKPNPDGPSATPNICPDGMKLGKASDNVAHSNRRFGLRVFTYSARKYSCLDTFDQNLVDVYSMNPAIQSKFDNYTLWKNQEAGLLGEKLGFCTFNDFKIIDSGLAGAQFYKTNLTLENVTLQNSVIVGYSAGNAPLDIDNTLRETRGLITPRTDGFKVVNLKFVNFGATMTPLKACSKCQNMLLWVTGGKTTFFKQISFENILGDYVYWNIWRRQIYVDEDGTLTKPLFDSLPAPASISSHLQTQLVKSYAGTAPPAAVITPYKQYLNFPNHCYQVVNKWDNVTYCDETITIRSILFTNADPSFDFQGMTIKCFKLQTPTQSDDPNVAPLIGSQPVIIIKKSMDIIGSWSLPYATGYYYHIHWQNGIDFQHLSLAPSQYWGANEGIVLRFNYTDERQLYEIAHYYQQRVQLPFIVPSNSIIDPNTCQNGDYYHDKVERQLYACVSGRNKTIREWIDLTGIRCRSFCPVNSPLGERETFLRFWSNITQWPNATLPAAGQNVTIPFEWNLILDINPPAFNYVHINGNFIFDSTQDLTFQAKYIWVAQGGIYIGSKAVPYTKNAKIILNGQKNDRYLVLDPYASGNKMLAVTGALQFYGTVPDNVWTKLIKIAKIGDKSIEVQNATGWAIGNQIVIGPSYAGQTEDEVFTITGISGTTINLNDTLKYEHYGDPNILKNSKNVVIMDVRSAVGLLTRNIKIMKGPDANNWGCRVLVYSYLEHIKDSDTATPMNGYAIFDGVQIVGCSQYDSQYAALRIQKLGTLAPNAQKTMITRSSIHHCNGLCMYLDKIDNVTIHNNVFYFGRRFLVIAYIVNHYQFTSNLLIGARDRPEVTQQNADTHIFIDTACYEQYIPIKFGTDVVNVSKNIAQGSKGEGFVFPFSPCSKLNTYNFADNTAGSCLVAFAAQVLEGELCIGAAGFKGYASQIGFIANPGGSQTSMEYQDMLFIDNGRGFTLRYAHEIDDNTMFMKNSYFMGYSRPSCVSCYSDTTIPYCNDGYAIRMFTATIGGKHFPLGPKITGFDIICNQQSFDAKAFLTNVTFQNYQYSNTDVPYCSHMSVFRKHNLASDATASHHLVNCPCINCDHQSLAYFQEADPGQRGWDGGCGQAMDCTGAINYFIEDHDGKFTGTNSPSQLLANNTVIGGNQSACVAVPEWNGHMCSFQQLAVLEYESIAADFNKRQMWPVYLRYDGGQWNSTTNAWREWQWDGPTPKQLRLARFWSVFRRQKIYNMTFASQPPSDMHFQIQKRQLPDGNPNDWGIFRIYYPLPNIILVRVTNTSTNGNEITVDSFPQINGVYQDLTKYTDVCGANNYIFQNSTIVFVVNGVADCKVRLTVSSFMQITTRLKIDIDTFYKDQGDLSFLSKLVAFLGIDPGQLKIVSVNTGSTITKVVIYPKSIFNPSVSVNSSSNSTEFNVTTPSDPAQDHNELKSMGNKIQTAIITGDLNFGYDVMNFDTKVTILSTAATVISLCPETFLYNAFTQKCYCDTAYANITNKCKACEIIGNATNATDPTNSAQCVCIDTYIWSTTQNKCVCAVNSIIIDGSCFSCNSVANSTNVADYGKELCVCRPTYTFFPSQKKCRCDDLQAVIIGNICFNCSTFGNGTGKALFLASRCECKPTYLYNNSTKQCLCSVSNYIILANGSCLTCTKNGNSTNKTISSNQTCGCLATFVFNQQFAKCICSDLQAVIISGKCINCSNPDLANNNNRTGKGNFLKNQCICLDTYVWDPVKYKCICNSTSILVDGKCLGCDKIGNGTGKVATSTACGCLLTFIFSVEQRACLCPDVNSYVDINKKCSASCTGFGGINGTGKPHKTLKQCECKPTFDIVGKTCACNATSALIDSACLNCKVSKFNFSNVGVSDNKISCKCLTNFTFDASTKTCICGLNAMYISPKCYLCASLPRTSVSTSSGLSKCECPPGLTFDTKSMSCLCTTTTFIYITATNTCIDCTDVSITGLKKINQISCTCPTTTPKLKWSTKFQACACAQGQILISSICTKCSALANTKLTSISPIECSCLDSFVWNSVNHVCECPVNSIIGLNRCIICDESVGASSIKDSASCNCIDPSVVWNVTTASCSICAAADVIIKHDGSCITCKGLDSTTIGTVDTYNCKCGPNQIWDNIKYKCVACTSISNGKTKLTQLTCKCIDPYIFDVFTNTCIKQCLLAQRANIGCLNCTLIPQADKAALLNQKNKIVLKDSNLINNQYASLLTLLNKYSTYQCLCKGQYKWENSRKRCYMRA